MTDLLEAQLEQYLDPKRKKPFPPKFASELERRYDEDGRAAQCRSDLIVGLAGIVIFNLFLYNDHQLNPAVFYSRALVFRLLVYTPCALVAIAAALRWPGRKVHDLTWSASVIAAGLCSLFICRDLNVASSLLCPAGMMIILTFGTLVNPASFAYALGFNVLLVAAEMIFMLRDTWLSFEEKNAAVLLLASSSILSLTANYKMERADRMTYVLLLRETIRGRHLALRNQELAELSQVDALTGLANRRHFDCFLRDAWDEALRRAAPISLVMIDIDHFKRLNDAHGHLAGDEVLRFLGKLLQETVRAESDLSARYGGEEFAIVLPRTSLDQAGGIAEELRQRIREASFLRASGEDFPAITVSCGVASCVPRVGDGETGLIAVADRALYAAKRSGRNRVCVDDEARQAPAAGVLVA